MAKNDKWTKEEDDFLIRCYDSTNILDIAKELEGRTLASVKGRITKLQRDKLIKVITNRYEDLKDDERMCGKCKKVLNVSEFHAVFAKHRIHECKECSRERRRLASTKLRIANDMKTKNYKRSLEDADRISNELKKGSYECIDCNKTLPGTEFYYSKKTGKMISRRCKKCEIARKRDSHIEKIKNFRGNE